MNGRKLSPALWLWILFALICGDVALSLLNYLPIPDGWITWVQKLLLLGVVVCAYNLSGQSIFYRGSAIVQAVQLGCSLVAFLISRWSLGQLEDPNAEVILTVTGIVIAGLSLVSMTAGWVGTYWLYRGHGEWVSPVNPTVERYWRRVFVIQIIASLCCTLLSLLLSTQITGEPPLLNTFVLLVYDAIDVLPLLLLWYTIRILQKQEIA